MRAIGLRMKMDMRGSVRQDASSSHEPAVNAPASFAEGSLKSGNINGLRAEAAPMIADRPARGAVAFGAWAFDRASGLLTKNGVEVPLPPRVVGVLALLLDRPGQLVTKHELMAGVWRDAFVTETSLAEAISVLRQTLGDDPQRPAYIQTLHRRGYRFVAEVRERAEPRTVEAALPAAEPAPSAPTPVEPEPRLTLLIPWLVALFASVVAAIAGWKYLTSVEPPPRSPVRLTLALPTGLTLAAGAPVAVSRDGTLIALSLCRAAATPGVGPSCAIYLRPLSHDAPTLVAGTSGGAAPFFAPDGGTLGYFAGGRLRTIALAGGSPVALAPAAEPLGAAWTADGRIVFAGSGGGGLSVVPARGGSVEPLTMPAAGGSRHMWPHATPDGSSVVFTVADSENARDGSYAGVVSLKTRAWSRLMDGVSGARAPARGYLVAQRGPDLLGILFDERAAAVIGLPVVVGAGVLPEGGPHYAVSEAGLLVTGSPGGAALHVTLDWDGELRRLVPAPQPAVLR
jgi:DNA-binding winged helix-turn-helix (wHTH) protein